MARTSSKQDFGPILAAFRHWIDRCLIGDSSVFTDEALWTPANVEEVQRAFVDHPDESSDNFSVKLKRQIKNASPAAQQLMAEMLWALLLFPSNTHAGTKRQLVREIWALSGRELGDSPLLSDEVLRGIGSGGQGFNNYRPAELEFLIALTSDLKQRTRAEREKILTDYEAFVEWIEKVPRRGSRQFRHMLRFAAFPDRVERMSSNGDRRRVLEALEGISPKESKDWSDRELDEALLKLRRRLEAESPSTVLDFYNKALSDRWKPKDDDDPNEDTPPPHGRRYWIEKTITRDRPDRLNGDHALGKALWSPQKDQRGADIYRFMREVRPGDIILHLTDNSGFTGVSVAASGAEDFGGVPDSEWGGSGAHYRIPLRDFHLLTPSLPRQVFFSSPTKEQLISLLDQGQKNVFYSREPSLNQGAYLTPASPELVAVLDEAYQRLAGKAMIEGLASPLAAVSAKMLSNVVDRFAAALAQSHVTFGIDVVRSFVASLATKPFAILTGLSGSGKTQLALQFGHWLGADRVEIIPVRPDWTGAEALFGYENALVPKIDGKAAWHVPPALKFMLRAAADPRNPYVLVLDEMNLAHVERYFADFLSGMESDEPCLPNLTESNGEWRPKATPQIAVPQNLFVIGTVNVDETTYMFSPKVLDRANTFEFRVATDSLQIDSRRPQPCPQGDPSLTQGFLAVARDDEWQVTNSASERDILVRQLRDLHRLLTRTGFEFGHRVFYEAIRFAAMLTAAGQPDPLVALDHQIMQKILPRLHGSRRRLETTLCSAAHFCFDLVIEAPGSETAITFDPVDPPQGTPRLPLSFDKIQRMTRTLRQNQFASFTE